MRIARPALAWAFAAAALAFVAAVFWFEDWRYSLPTPRPAHVTQPPVGAALALPAELADLAPRGEVVLLHFFNPACPCSRFNVDHVRDLVGAYRGRARFVCVLQGDDREALESAFRWLDLDVAHVDDLDGALAARFGVYSTPQAVVLDRHGNLFFRGNYNASRYCTDRPTQFARAALDAALRDAPPPQLDPRAYVAYGCKLPSDA